MKEPKDIKNKLTKLGFKVLKVCPNKDEDEKENAILYKTLGNNIDLVISRDNNIVRFLNLNLSEIESFQIIKNYITIIMKNGTAHELKEIKYESLDQELLLVLVENKSSRKNNSFVNL